MNCKKCGKPAEIANFDLSEMLCIECDWAFFEWEGKQKKTPEFRFRKFLNV